VRKIIARAEKRGSLMEAFCGKSCHTATFPQPPTLPDHARGIPKVWPVVSGARTPRPGTIRGAIHQGIRRKWRTAGYVVDS
jgi:hypothetical protein